MTPLTIAVTGVNAVDNPGPGCGVARSLREDPDLNATVIGLGYDAMEPGLYMDWLFDHQLMMPYPSAAPETLIERLLYIKSQYGLDAVIPNFDVELPLYIHLADELAELGIRTFLPTRKQFELRNKKHLPELAKAIGIASPRTIAVSSPAEFEAALLTIGFPAMVKGPYYKAYRVTNRDQAIDHCLHLANDWGWPILVQEIVSGVELNLVGVGDGRGGSLGLVAVKKMWITELGKMWTGITVRHPAMLDAAEAFLRHTRWRGPFELECMCDADGRVNLIEINPRFPAWVYGATGVGINLPARMIRTLFEQPLTAPPDYPAGKLYVRYAYEMITDTASLQALVTQGER